jgi:hypothetical protein
LPASKELATLAGLLQGHLKAEIEKWVGILRKAGVQPVD